jgi:hypothetical protein
MTDDGGDELYPSSPSDTSSANSLSSCPDEERKRNQPAKPLPYWCVKRDPNNPNRFTFIRRKIWVYKTVGGKTRVRIAAAPNWEPESDGGDSVSVTDSMVQPMPHVRSTPEPDRVQRAHDEYQKARAYERAMLEKYIDAIDQSLATPEKKRIAIRMALDEEGEAMESIEVARRSASPSPEEQPGIGMFSDLATSPRLHRFQSSANSLFDSDENLFDEEEEEDCSVGPDTAVTALMQYRAESPKNREDELGKEMQEGMIKLEDPLSTLKRLA